MGITKKLADVETRKLLDKVLKEKYYEVLRDVKVSFCLIFAETDDAEKPALTLHGWPCAATIRATGPLDRLKGQADVDIQIDVDNWTELEDAQKEALLDHELFHLDVQIDTPRDGKKPAKAKLDWSGRPRMKMRPHDFEIGGFAEVARRRGDDAPEVLLVRKLRAKYDQLFLWHELDKTRVDMPEDPESDEESSTTPAESKAA